MRKPVLCFTAPLTLLTLFGALLRRLELASALDPQSGLQRFVPATAILIALGLLLVLWMLLLVRKLDCSGIPGTFEQAFRPATVLPLAVAALGMLLYLIGAFYLARRWWLERCVVCGLLALMACLSGAGWLNLSISHYRPISDREKMLSASLQVLFFCLWLVVFYKENAADPSLWKTIWAYLGLCATLVTVYGLAGFIVGRAKPRKCLAVGALAVYLDVLAAVGSVTPSDRLFFIASAAQLLLCMLALLQPRSEAAASEPPAAPPPGGGGDGMPPEEDPAEPCSLSELLRDVHALLEQDPPRHGSAKLPDPLPEELED